MRFRMEADEVERRFLLLWLVDGEGEAEEIHCRHGGISGWQYGDMSKWQDGRSKLCRLSLSTDESHVFLFTRCLRDSVVSSLSCVVVDEQCATWIGMSY